MVVWDSFTIGENLTAYDVLEDIIKDKLALFHFVSVDKAGQPLKRPQFRIGMFYLNQERIATASADYDMGLNVFSISSLRHIWAERTGVEVVVTAKDAATGESTISATERSRAYDEAPDKQTIRINLGSQRSPCLLYTSPSPRDRTRSRMPSSA